MFVIGLIINVPCVASSSLTTAPHSTAEALLIGWYLQATSHNSSQLEGLVSQLEREVFQSGRDISRLHPLISQLEMFLSQIPATILSNDVEATNLRETLLILSDAIFRTSASIRLLERMAFFTNPQTPQRLQELRFAYPRALESLSLCYKSLQGLQQEISDWRNCVLIVESTVRI